MFTVETRLGTISVGKNIIGKIITEVIKSFHGKVILSNHKGKVPKFVPKIGNGDDSSNMEITLSENGLDIRVFVVLRFGTSITQVTNRLADDIHSRIKTMTGMEPNSVAIVVTGMISKNIAPRHIEVTR